MRKDKKPSPNWEYVSAELGAAGVYRLNGWTVYCRGAGWYIRTPSGYTIERCFARSATAKRAVEKMLDVCKEVVTGNDWI